MSALLRFARNRHRLSRAARAIGERSLVDAERNTYLCIWALDVLAHVFHGEIDQALTIVAAGPHHVEIGNSVNVEYARFRHRGSVATPG